MDSVYPQAYSLVFQMAACVVAFRVFRLLYYCIFLSLALSSTWKIVSCKCCAAQKHCTSPCRFTKSKKIWQIRLHTMAATPIWEISFRFTKSTMRCGKCLLYPHVGEVYHLADVKTKRTDVKTLKPQNPHR